MGEPFRVTRRLRAANAVARFALRAGLPVGRAQLLSVPGRVSGRMRSTPVSPVVHDGRRWLVASTSRAAWVANARASGWGTLRKGRTPRRVRLVETYGLEGAAVAKEFALSVARGRWFSVAPEAPVEDYVGELAEHPVFAVVDDGG